MYILNDPILSMKKLNYIEKLKIEKLQNIYIYFIYTKIRIRLKQLETLHLDLFHYKFVSYNRQNPVTLIR